MNPVSRSIAYKAKRTKRREAAAVWPSTHNSHDVLPLEPEPELEFCMFVELNAEFFFSFGK